MQETTSQRSFVLKGVAAALNAGGRAVAAGLDLTCDAFGGVRNFSGKLVGLPARGGKVAASGLKVFARGKTRGYEEQIRQIEQHIKQRYLEIGKHSAQAEGTDDAHKETVQRLIADIRQHESEIERLRGCIGEAKAARKAAPAPVRQPAAKPAASAARGLGEAIERALKKGVFQSASEQATFRKIAEDLLDEEPEIRLLAASELGKSGIAAAVPVLLEAAYLDDPELTVEIINALINLGDGRAMPLFTEFAAHPRHRVRMACLRGIYKLGDEETAGPLLIAALRDENPEVRRAGVTFLGWKDYADAGAALIPCLRDEDDKVRKGAVAALANLNDPNAVLPLIKVLGDDVLEIREKALEAVCAIAGEPLEFDVAASGSALEKAIEETLEWWQRKRSGDAAPAPKAEAADAPETAEEPAPFDGAAIFSGPDFAAMENAPAGGLTEADLEGLGKGDLISLCNRHGVACDPLLSKDAIKALLLDAK